MLKSVICEGWGGEIYEKKGMKWGVIGGGEACFMHTAGVWCARIWGVLEHDGTWWNSYGTDFRWLLCWCWADWDFLFPCSIDFGINLSFVKQVLVEWCMLLKKRKAGKSAEHGNKRPETSMHKGFRVFHRCRFGDGTSGHTMAQMGQKKMLKFFQ